MDNESMQVIVKQDGSTQDKLRTGEHLSRLLAVGSYGAYSLVVKGKAVATTSLEITYNMGWADTSKLQVETRN